MLLLRNDPPPTTIDVPDGGSRFVLIGDHAGRAIPGSLGSLGLAEAELSRHIGWDIGIARMGTRLATLLDAPFVRQTYSRLVIDCNRAPGAATSIPEASDGTPVPGNAALTHRDRAAREAAIHAPYQQAVADVLDARADLPTILVALHSFTPSMGGRDRPWHVGVLHDRGDTRFAAAMLAVLGEEADLVVGDNEPYRMDQIDYTIPRHAYPRDLPYAELEIRQDLLASDADCDAWAERLADLLARAAALMEAGGR